MVSSPSNGVDEEDPEAENNKYEFISINRVQSITFAKYSTLRSFQRIRNIRFRIRDFIGILRILIAIGLN